MKVLAVNALAAFALCALAVILAVLVVLLLPDFSWATVFEWMTTTGPSPCGCIVAE